MTLTNSQYIKRSKLVVYNDIFLALNKGDKLEAYENITELVTNVGDITETLTKSNLQSGGVILPNLSLSLNNNRGQFDKKGKYFKDGFVNNSAVKVETYYKTQEWIPPIPPVPPTPKIYTEDFSGYNAGDSMRVVDDWVSYLFSGGDVTTFLVTADPGAEAKVVSGTWFGGDILERAGFSALTDYIVEFDTLAYGSGRWIFGVRCSASGCYWIQCLPGNPGNEFVIDKGTRNYPNASVRVASAVPPATTSKIKIKCEGANIKVWADGVLFLDYTDGTPLLTGSIGVGAFLSGWKIGNIVMSELVEDPGTLEIPGYFEEKIIEPKYIYNGLIKNSGCVWNQKNNKLKLDVVNQSSLLNTEEVRAGTLSKNSFLNICLQLLNRQPFKKYFVASALNFSFGYDAAGIVDNPNEYVNKKVKEVLDEIMELSGSYYYIDYDGNLIIKPNFVESPTAVTTLRGDDIIDIVDIKPDRDNHLTAWRWAIDNAEVARKQTPYNERQIYQYDYRLRTVTSKAILSTQRKSVLNFLHSFTKWLRLDVDIVCKWNPDILVGEYIKLDIPAEPLYNPDNFIWNDSDWNNGKFWSLPQQGTTFSSVNFWRVVQVKRAVDGESMSLRLNQHLSDDNK